MDLKNSFQGKDWIDAELDYCREDYNALIDFAIQLKNSPVSTHHEYLKNQTIYLIFFNQSLRTRSSFETGITQLGGHASVLDPIKIYAPAMPGEDIPYSTERVADIARVLASYGEAIAIRMYGDPVDWCYGKANQAMKEFSKWSKIPIISMECDKFHPGQALADLITLKEHLKDFKKKKMVISWAYSGSWHKPVAVPQSAVLATTKMGMDVVLAHPPGFELDAEVITHAQEFARESGGSFSISHDMDEAFEGADVVYPKSWVSLSHLPNPPHKSLDEEGMQRLFQENQHWICTKEKLALAKPEVRYMHCLPCDRGQEVTDEVLDGPHSIVFEQAANRLHANKTIMSHLMGK